MRGIQDKGLELLVVYQYLILNASKTLQVRHQIFVGQVLPIENLHYVLQFGHGHVPVVVSVDRADDLEYFKKSCQVLSKQVGHSLSRDRVKGLFGPSTWIPKVAVEVYWCLIQFGIGGIGIYFEVALLNSY